MLSDRFYGYGCFLGKDRMGYPQWNCKRFDDYILAFKYAEKREASMPWRIVSVSPYCPPVFHRIFLMWSLRFPVAYRSVT